MWRFRVVALLACTLAACSIGCRTPETRLAENPASAYIYDPHSSHAIAERFNASDEERARLARYRTALAEPVSVVAWNDDRSTSRVFFATNRTPKYSPDGRLEFGGEWGRQLTLGECMVTLPRGQRGTIADAPKATTSLTAWLPGRRASSGGAAVAPSLDSTSGFTDAHYFAALRDEVARSPEHDVLLFVHGFNVDFQASMTRAAQIAIDLPFNGAIIAYSWPSQGGVGNYSTDEGIVAESAATFAQFVDQLEQSLSPGTKIHILVHSMGNRLVLNGLNHLPDRFRQPPRFANLVLAAPDVGVLDFQSLAPRAVSTAQRTTLYACDSDTALIASKGLHQQQRIGDAIPPVVMPGIETVSASAIDTSFMGHSYYGSNRAALSDLFALVKEDRGAAQRPWLEARSSPDGTWWAFAMQPTEIRFVWRFEHLAANATPHASAAASSSAMPLAPAIAR